MQNDNDVTETFVITNQWFTEMQNELAFFGEHWFELVPTGFTGTVPYLRKRNIIYKDEILTEENMLMNFSISYQRAFEIMQARSFYTNSVSFCRELVLNAFDATKIKFFNDIECRPMKAGKANNVCKENQAYEETYILLAQMFDLLMQNEK